MRRRTGREGGATCVSGSWDSSVWVEPGLDARAADLFRPPEGSIIRPPEDEVCDLLHAVHEDHLRLALASLSFPGPAGRGPSRTRRAPAPRSRIRDDESLRMPVSLPDLGLTAPDEKAGPEGRRRRGAQLPVILEADRVGHVDGRESDKRSWADDRARRGTDQPAGPGPLGRG